MYEAVSRHMFSQASGRSLVKNICKLTVHVSGVYAALPYIPSVIGTLGGVGGRGSGTILPFIGLIVSIKAPQPPVPLPP